MCCFAGTAAAWYPIAQGCFTIYARVQQELIDGTAGTAAILRIGVEIAGDDECRAGFESAWSTPIIAQIVAARRVNVVRPKSDLVMVAPTVAILGTIESGRGRVTDEKVQILCGAQSDRDIPMALL
jgi:hypothetical protein